MRNAKWSWEGFWESIDPLSRYRRYEVMVSGYAFVGAWQHYYTRRAAMRAFEYLAAGLGQGEHLTVKDRWWYGKNKKGDGWGCVPIVLCRYSGSAEPMTMEALRARMLAAQAS